MIPPCPWIFILHATPGMLQPTGGYRVATIRFVARNKRIDQPSKITSVG